MEEMQPARGGLGLEVATGAVGAAVASAVEASSFTVDPPGDGSPGEEEQLPVRSMSSGPMDFEHLRWLCSKDQQVCCRAKCAGALREENRLLSSLQANMRAFKEAREACRITSESDPNWFTLDVQDCFSRKVENLEGILRVFQDEVQPLTPKDAAKTDAARAPIYLGYARVAEKTATALGPVLETEQAQHALTQLRTRIGNIKERLGTAPPANEGVQMEAMGSIAEARDAELHSPSAGAYVPPAMPPGSPLFTGGAAPAQAAAAATAAEAVPDPLLLQAPAAPPKRAIDKNPVNKNPGIATELGAEPKPAPQSH